MSKSLRLLIVLVLAAVLMCAAALCLVVFPQQAASFVRPVLPALAESIAPEGGSMASNAGERLQASVDADLSTEDEERAYREAHKGHPKVNPLIAQCRGVDLRCPIDCADLTGVLFHQANTPWGLVMTTQLASANMEEVGTTRATRVNKDQFEGDWLDTEAMHVWRSDGSFDMDTSVDVGASAGTVMRAPVDGTVVLLRDYKLYEELDDVEIHIQPEGHPELDVVAIHTTDPLVKAGDTVQAGVTEIAHVRDIAAVLTDVQLMFYTEGDDPGNHTHIQVNDVNYPEYREKRLEGAIEVKEA